MADSAGKKTTEERIPFNFFKKIPKIVSIYEKDLFRGMFLSILKEQKNISLEDDCMIEGCITTT